MSDAHMTDRSNLELRLLGAAIFVGVLGDALLRTLPWGLNFLLWMVGLLAALVLLGPGRPEAFAGSGRWLFLPLIVFSLLFLWHDSPVLKLLNIFALLVGLSLVMLRAQGGKILLGGIVEYALGSAIAGLNAAFGIIPLVFGNAEWKKLQGDRGQQRTLAVARGIALAFPLLLIFGGLFMGADAVFKNLVSTAVRLNFRELFIHFFVTAFFAWIVGGYLRGMLFGKERGKVVGLQLPAPSIGAVEIGVVLGLLDLLFLLFVLVQLRYFFGGAALVQATTGLTYAEYARQGFFELLAVAVLALPLLLGAHYLIEKNAPATVRLFQILSGTLILLLFVVMISAFQRMRLYQDEYGLSQQRLYPTAFMGWLAVLFVWFSFTVLRGRREQFWFGAMVAGFALIALLHLINPDALIARTNLARAKAGRTFDARYVAWLSADAVPTLAEGLPDLTAPDRCKVAAGLLNRWPLDEGPDWRAWSRSRAQALQVMRENEARLHAMSCGQQQK